MNTVIAIIDIFNEKIYKCKTKNNAFKSMPICDFIIMRHVLSVIDKLFIIHMILKQRNNINVSDNKKISKHYHAYYK